MLYYWKLNYILLYTIFFSQISEETKLQDEVSVLPEKENDEKIDIESTDVFDLKSLTCMNITDEEKEILLSKNEGNFNFSLLFLYPFLETI